MVKDAPSAHSTDPSFSQTAFTPKVVQVGEVKSNLGSLSLYPDNHYKNEEGDFEEVTEKALCCKCDNLKPTDMIALEKKLTPRVNFQRSSCKSDVFEQHNLVRKNNNRMKGVLKRQRSLGRDPSLEKGMATIVGLLFFFGEPIYIYYLLYIPILHETKDVYV